MLPLFSRPLCQALCSPDPPARHSHPNTHPPTHRLQTRSTAPSPHHPAHPNRPAHLTHTPTVPSTLSRPGQQRYRHLDRSLCAAYPHGQRALHQVGTGAGAWFGAGPCLLSWLQLGQCGDAWCEPASRRSWKRQSGCCGCLALTRTMCTLNCPRGPCPAPPALACPALACLQPRHVLAAPGSHIN